MTGVAMRRRIVIGVLIVIALVLVAQFGPSLVRGETTRPSPRVDRCPLTRWFPLWPASSWTDLLAIRVRGIRLRPAGRRRQSGQRALRHDRGWSRLSARPLAAPSWRSASTTTSAASAAMTAASIGSSAASDRSGWDCESEPTALSASLDWVRPRTAPQGWPFAPSLRGLRP